MTTNLSPTAARRGCLTRLGGASAPRRRLFCLPFAGGGPAAYRLWAHGPARRRRGRGGAAAGPEPGVARSRRPTRSTTIVAHPAPEVRGGGRPALRAVRPQHGRPRGLRADRRPRAAGGAGRPTRLFVSGRRVAGRACTPAARPRPARRRVPRRHGAPLRRRARRRPRTSPTCWPCSCRRCAPTCARSRRTRRSPTARCAARCTCTAAPTTPIPVPTSSPAGSDVAERRHLGARLPRRPLLPRRRRAPP